MAVLVAFIVIVLFIGFSTIENVIKKHTEEMKQLNYNLQRYFEFIGVLKPEAIMKVEMHDGSKWDIKLDDNK